MRNPLLPATTLGAAVLVLTLGTMCSRSPQAPSTPMPPTVTSIFPTAALPNFSTTFHVTGAGFRAGAVVTIGRGRVTSLMLNDTLLSATAYPVEEGTFDVVVKNPDGQSGTLSRGVTFEVVIVSLTSSATIVAPGAPVTVSWIAPTRELAVTDWIGWFRSDDSSAFGNEISWQYVAGSSGSATLLAPMQPGEYEIRYLPSDGEVDVARVKFTVQ